MVTHSKRVLITGIEGFTGTHLKNHLENSGFEVYGLSLEELKSKRIYQCDIRNKEQLKEILSEVKPDYIIHLGAISFVGAENRELFYSVNTVGSENLLQAVAEVTLYPQKIILASSATVYGNQNSELLDESMAPKPINHYGISKFGMEQIASNYFDKFPIIVTRPFNYTGVGQSRNFLIPKIVSHYREKSPVIELGNLDVSREFNDIRFVVEVYERLLKSSATGEVVNIASNRPLKLLDVIEIMNKLAGYEIEVRVNPAFVRKNEIKSLSGSVKKLQSLIKMPKLYTLEETLRSMFEA